MKKIIVKILNKLGILEYFNFTFEITVNQKSIKIPLIGQIGRDNMNMTEPWMSKLLAQLLKHRPDTAYIDVGVNIGQTLIKLRTVDTQVQYIGFEPNPICVYYSQKLIAANQYKNTKIFPVGVSNENSMYELAFFSEANTDSAASMLEDFRPNQKTFRKEYIACFSPTEIFEKYNLPKIGILKIDVEGAEKEVLEGFAAKIVQDQPFIQLEILPAYNAENTDRISRQNAIEAFIKQINYTIFRVHTTPDHDFDRLEEINAIGIHSNLDWCEYVLVPQAEKAKLQF
jgi:FkbM family methyltransferase